ncbi:putative actin cytoskeleton-regulatory complex protein PAN1-like 5 [Homarus americanus]|uniref:Putative actin cytoskeleton-regulatory complex protein PAN1-like 5 n=1 Tax=Homarus americanus TaxID=6706 RepID=A0A8J5TG79_HOMAM|nr:putative actin cytoskeleton-regulatory complex protein PAN1-like 5 [Homarus americanus]
MVGLLRQAGERGVDDGGERGKAEDRDWVKEMRILVKWKIKSERGILGVSFAGTSCHSSPSQKHKLSSHLPTCYYVVVGGGGVEGLGLSVPGCGSRGVICPIGYWDEGTRGYMYKAKTILAPESIVLHSLIHQDAANPLYGSTPALAALRREFLLNHLVQEVLEFTDPRLNEKSGVKLLTFSGKDVTFTKDDQGQLFVNDVPAESESSYKDGTHIYILKGTLFDSKQKITKAFIRENSFNKELNGPTGPPLDIPNFDPVIRAPAPPPPGVVGPPAVPVIPSPPAPPPSAFREFVRAPAPPPPASSDVIIFPSRHGQVRSDV